MSRWQNFKLSLIAITLLCLCIGEAQAQSTPMNCDVLQSMTFDESEIAGTWYEIARYPQPTEPYECVQVNFTAESNGALDIATTYSNTPSYPWVNQTMYASIPAESTAGYNISYQNGPTMTPPAIFKLIYTNYDNYTLICGYQDPTVMSSYFGVLLMRERMPPTDEVEAIIAQASMSYAQFPNNSMVAITQNEFCTTNGSSSPYAMALVTIVFALAALKTLF